MVRPPAPKIFLSSSLGSARFVFQILRFFQIVDRLEMPQVRNAGLALHLLTAFKYRKSPSLVILSPSSVILSAAKDLFQLTQGKLREESLSERMSFLLCLSWDLNLREGELLGTSRKETGAGRRRNLSCALT